MRARDWGELLRDYTRKYPGDWTFTDALTEPGLLVKCCIGIGRTASVASTLVEQRFFDESPRAAANAIEAAIDYVARQLRPEPRSPIPMRPKWRGRGPRQFEYR